MLVAASPSLMLFACNDKKTDVTAVTSEEIVPVEVVKVQPSNLQRVVDLVGTVRHRRETPLGFTSAGKVASVRYDVGDFVKRGALIAALDGTNVSADMSVARAEKQRADAEFSRIAALFKQGWVTKGRYEAAETAAKAADARVAQAGFATGTSQLYAPSSGVILARQVQPGQVVSPGTPAVLLGQDDEGFVFRAPVAGTDASKLRVGMPAVIVIDSIDGGTIEAAISEIDGRANAETGAFTIQFRVPARGGVRSGQIGSVKIKLPAENDGSMQIPASALFGVRTGEGLVYVVDLKSNQVQTRNVAIGQLTDGFVTVNGGILAGDMIVTSGTEKLRNGSKVKPVQAVR
jgi:RND family efflux transporter MFP subunit